MRTLITAVICLFAAACGNESTTEEKTNTDTTVKANLDTPGVSDVPVTTNDTVLPLSEMSLSGLFM
jgi:hypothetical protein